MSYWFFTYSDEIGHWKEGEFVFVWMGGVRRGWFGFRLMGWIGKEQGKASDYWLQVENNYLTFLMWDKK